MADQPMYLSLRDVARLVGVSSSVVAYGRDHGFIPVAAFMLNGDALFDQASVDAYQTYRGARRVLIEQHKQQRKQQEHPDRRRTENRSLPLPQIAVPVPPSIIAALRRPSHSETLPAVCV